MVNNIACPGSLKLSNIKWVFLKYHHLIKYSQVTILKVLIFLHISWCLSSFQLLFNNKTSMLVPLSSLSTPGLKSLSYLSQLSWRSFFLYLCVSFFFLSCKLFGDLAYANGTKQKKKKLLVFTVKWLALERTSNQRNHAKSDIEDQCRPDVCQILSNHSGGQWGNIINIIGYTYCSNDINANKINDDN